LLKKISALLLFAFIFIGFSTFNVSAESTKNVIDYIGHLDGNIQALQTQIESTINKTNLDVVVVLTDNTDGKSSMAYADDYYDENGFGIGSDYSGILLLIDLDNNKLWISTTGQAINIFTDVRIESILDDVYAGASKKDYYKASTAFLSNVEYYVSQGVPDGQYQEDEYGNKTYYNQKKLTYAQKLKLTVKNPIVYIIPLVVGLLVVLIAGANSKGKVTVNEATYEGQGSFYVGNKQDTFIRKSVSTVRKQSSSGGGSGGSSTHTGSSGRSHGGGGRSL